MNKVSEIWDDIRYGVTKEDVILTMYVILNVTIVAVGLRNWNRTIKALHQLDKKQLATLNK